MPEAGAGLTSRTLGLWPVHSRQGEARPSTLPLVRLDAEALLEGEADDGAEGGFVGLAQAPGSIRQQPEPRSMELLHMRRDTAREIDALSGHVKVVTNEQILVVELVYEGGNLTLSLAKSGSVLLGREH